jgi:uncharacterized protein YndB with AHSA1/START domain
MFILRQTSLLMKKIEKEYLIHCSPRLLFSMISTSNGLAEWFADKVEVRHDKYSFHWDGSDQNATLIASKENEFVRFRWEKDEDTGYYFEFKIVVDSLTNDVALVITDFCEADEENETIMLWDRQVADLKHSIGA